MEIYFKIFVILSFIVLSSCRRDENAVNIFNKPVYQYQEAETRWSSFENITAGKGIGAKANNGAKGHACEYLNPGQSFTLLNIEGPGIINRIWVTISQRTTKMLRSLRIEMFWDGCKKPAVSAPLGDFFGIGLGQKTPFENELFADPEGTSFNCFIQMPFSKSARMVITNESDILLERFFFDIDLLKLKKWEKNNLYFHCYWHRDTATTLGVDFKILPKVKGRGRFLGSNVGVIANPIYGNHWWGEGEVKMYIDGDTDFPTLVGSGTEDYIGTAWGQGKFACRYFGSMVADKKKGLWCFYRYHIPDPVFFDSNIQVTIQQIGHSGNHAGRLALAAQMQKEGAPLIPIAITEGTKFHLLLESEKPVDIADGQLPPGPMKYYRSDDVSATAYFYLDKPENDLPATQPLELRICNLK